MKFELGDTVFFMKENVPQSGEILTRMQVENAFEVKAIDESSKKLFTFFGPAGIYYVTTKGVVNEKHCYKTAVELCKILFPDLLIN